MIGTGHASPYVRGAPGPQVVVWGPEAGPAAFAGRTCKAGKMENTLLIGLSRQMALERQLNVVANNIANAQTAGYKGETLLFEQFLTPTAGAGESTTGGSQLAFVIDADSFRRFGEGPMVSTGNPLDIAIKGDGWLVVETDAGERYTRNGHLRLDADGELVTSEGDRVLSGSGPVSFGSDEIDITIASDGTISTNLGEKGKLRVVDFPGDAQLTKEGNNLFSADKPPRPATGYHIAQGAVEGSNVEPVTEIAKMIEVTRNYVTTARLLNDAADLKSRAINELGQLPTAA